MRIRSRRSRSSSSSSTAEKCLAVSGEGGGGREREEEETEQKHNNEERDRTRGQWGEEGRERIIYQVPRMDERERERPPLFFFLIFPPSLLFVTGRLPSLEGRDWRTGMEGGRKVEKERERV